MTEIFDPGIFDHGIFGGRVVAIARGFIGTPYRHQGSLKGVGCDCLGLIRGVWRELYGVEPEVPAPYAPDWAERAGEERLVQLAADIAEARRLARGEQDENAAEDDGERIGHGAALPSARPITASRARERKAAFSSPGIRRSGVPKRAVQVIGTTSQLPLGRMRLRLSR